VKIKYTKSVVNTTQKLSRMSSRFMVDQATVRPFKGKTRVNTRVFWFALHGVVLPWPPL
jgi:hypothetical protein